MEWMNILYLVGACFMLWLAVRLIRSNPESFSRANMGKSLYTIGWLTVMIIGVVAFCVFFCYLDGY